jgi:uncharacterized protein YydD (DUF2326 family)
MAHASTQDSCSISDPFVFIVRDGDSIGLAILVSGSAPHRACSRVVRVVCQLVHGMTYVHGLVASDLLQRSFQPLHLKHASTDLVHLGCQCLNGSE